MDIQVLYLQQKPEAAAIIARWFKEEWPDFFAAVSEQTIAADFLQRTNTNTIPMALLSLNNNSQITGTVSITHSSITTRPQLGPWLSGLYVQPQFRHCSIATQLIKTVETLAPQLGCNFLYAGTSVVQLLFKQLNWEEIEVTPYHGQQLSIFRKKITP
ncbi:N-acetyltransferase [Sphingobacteriales bacterium UPWRP_1]|nr:hypothetical protein B6N25_06880 [Sphingobacteriales bacterium TSM_CSS]PSJ77266.1 N-acetyltransferase [Sphingobacteriales bacterium UPWRP_1]